MRKRPGYDVLDTRWFSFVPLWGLPVFFAYAMRRVDCGRCGVTVEAVPWATGKMQATHALVWFLASWAKVLSWKEVARRFHSTWDTVFRCVEHAVRWGLEHRSLEAILSIGVDELSWKKRHKYLTLVYQLDYGRRRLLHIARDRTAQSFHAFFDMLGDERTQAIVFVASDMWKAFFRVVRAALLVRKIHHRLCHDEVLRVELPPEVILDVCERLWIPLPRDRHAEA
jgi:transposase